MYLINYTINNKHHLLIFFHVNHFIVNIIVIHFLTGDVLDSQSFDQEAEDVCVLVNGLGGWFAATMAGLSLHHDHQRVGLLASLAQGVLEGGNVFEAVAGNHPVVMVRGHQEDGWILTRGGHVDVVERGDLPKVVELISNVTAPIVTDPSVANGELLEPQ